ncbi:MAG: hypothetical protein ACRDQB_14675, partial [Thermocrispum sp.]
TPGTPLGPGGPPRPALPAEVAYQLRLATGWQQLGEHLNDALSPRGYRIPLAGGPASEVVLRAEVFERELVDVLDGDLGSTRSQSTETSAELEVTGDVNASVTADFRTPHVASAEQRPPMGLTTGPIRLAHGQATSSATQRSAVPGSPGRPGGGRNLVRFAVRWEVTPVFRAGAVSRSWSTPARSGLDGPILAEADDRTLAVLGLEAPAQVEVDPATVALPDDDSDLPDGGETGDLAADIRRAVMHRLRTDELDADRDLAAHPERGARDLAEQLRTGLVAETASEPDPAAGPEPAVEQDPPSEPGIDVSWVPGYLRDSRGLGAARQVGAVRGADVDAALRSLLRDGAAVQGAELIGSMAAANAGAFLGNGRTFAVTVDGIPHELTVRARLQWNAAAVQATETVSEPNAPATKVRVAATQNATASDSAQAILPVTVTAMPPLVVSVIPKASTRPNQSDDVNAEHEHKVRTAVEFGGLHRVRLPMVYELSLAGPKGEADPSVLRDADNPATPVVRGSVDLDVPDLDVSREDLPGSPVTAAPPSAFAVEEVITDVPQGADPFTHLTGHLPKPVARMGAPGRSSLRAFLGDPAVTARLLRSAVTGTDPDPEAGWVSSEVLFRSGGSASSVFGRGSAVQVRAVARRYQVLEHRDGVVFTGARSSKDTVTAKDRGRRFAGVELSVAGGTQVGPMIWTLGPMVGWTDEHIHTVTRERISGTRTEVRPTGPMVRYRMSYELQARVAGHRAVTLPGDTVGYLWSPRAEAERAGVLDMGPADDPLRPFRRGPGRTHYAPQYLELGRSIGPSRVAGLDVGQQLYRMVADTLRDVPGRSWYHLSSASFLRQFDDRAFAAGLTPRLAEVLRRGEQARTRLSGHELSFLVNQLLGPGLTIPLVKRGTFHDYTVNLVLRGRITDLADGDLLDAGSTKVATKVKEGTGRVSEDRRSHTVELGLQSSARAMLPHRVYGIMTAGVRAGFTWAKSSTVGSGGRQVWQRSNGA